MVVGEVVNRFKQHAMSDDAKLKSNKLREEYMNLADIIDIYCTDSREKALALTHLEESLFFVNADLARNCS